MVLSHVRGDSVCYFSFSDGRNFSRKKRDFFHFLRVQGFTSPRYCVHTTGKTTRRQSSSSSPDLPTALEERVSFSQRAVLTGESVRRRGDRCNGTPPPLTVARPTGEGFRCPRYDTVDWERDAAADGETVRLSDGGDATRCCCEDASDVAREASGTWWEETWPPAALRIDKSTRGPGAR